MITWALDTDHLSILERGGSAALPLQMRMGQVVGYEIGTTIVSYEEQMRGWLAYAAQARTPERLIQAYSRLELHIQTFRDTPLLPYNVLAADEFERLQQAHIRIGTSDLRIAAICLANDATLLTRNLKDFGKVPGLRAEDWSA